MRRWSILMLVALALPGGSEAATVQVRSGDTLSVLALRHKTSVSALLNANPGIRPRELRIGQVLQLPSPPIRSRGGITVRSASTGGPAALPLQGRLTTPFSAAHGGLDLAAPRGTPIRSVMAGTVREAAFDVRNGWGWTVVIDHGGGYTTRYSHNSVNLVTPGQRVSAGQTIARVGSTGNSTGPHVDFRLAQAGRPVNPELLF
ncbi:M23 family metallopeptidase [Deinococcus humi]|uniref:Murein DD-endopeptidase MepM/ murein hydrolase activator NlpD n=1 Tax=Deinococcus humi TaxID=662880 RepID=A0A7W8NEL3_9DEIO|nr:LysM peptidoglycan-binding domain-containing M23 family metallopeptidase [Deinococcus humi]MBB5364469.1 murein DD-endopeptidase MepM/ murein hydrolase activator NlpD [Deinococcus humi]